MDRQLVSRLALIAEWLEAEWLRLQLPGAVLGYFTPEGLQWSHGIGVADLEEQTAFNPDTRFRVASISKLLTATMVLQARDKGIVDLEAPVALYLPWFNLRQSFDTARPITVKQLLLHTAGLPREAGYSYWNDPKEFPDRAAMQARIAELHTVFPPDEQYKYSNLGIALAGEVLEAVSKVPFAQLLKKQLLDPLGMSDTVVTPSSDTPRLARGYLRKEIAVPRAASPFADTRGLTAAAGVCSTLADIAKFMAFHFSANESPVLSLETRAEMHRAHFIESDWKSGRGLGFRLRRVHGVTSIGHEGWLMGYRSYAGFIPEVGAGLILFINADDVGPFPIVSQAFKMLLPVVSRTVPRCRAPQNDRPLASYCGKFRSTWSDCLVFTDGESLFLSYLGDSDPTDSQFRLDWLEGDSFRLLGTDGGAAIGERVTFAFEGRAAADSVRIGDVFSSRVR